MPSPEFLTQLPEPSFRTKDSSEPVHNRAAELFLQEILQRPEPLRQEKPEKDYSLGALAPHFWETLGKKGTDGINKEDLKSAFRNKQLSPEDAAVLCILRDHFDEFKKPGAKDIKLKDLELLAPLAEKVNSKLEVMRTFEKQAQFLIPAIDTNGDGRVSQKEVQAAKADRKLPMAFTTLLPFMEDNYKTLVEADPDYKSSQKDGITFKGIQKHVNKFYTEPNWETSFVRSIEGLIAEAVNPKLSRDLYADKIDPVKSIVPDAVMQGSLGDCYFLSAAASLAKIKPEAIKDMIVDNGDDTYTVTFPYTPGEQVTVTKPTNQEILTYARGSEHGMWPAVLEKAYGAWIDKSIWRRNIFNSNPEGDPQKNADGGSLLHHGLVVLTGGFANHYFLSRSTDPSRIEQLIVNGLQNQRAMTCVTGLSETDTALPTKHEYSVLDYDATTKMVTVRNPWGHFEARNDWGRASDGKNDGIFKVSIADFCKKFVGVAVARYTP